MTVSDERLAYMLERQLAGYLTITTGEITDLLTELQSARSLIAAAPDLLGACKTALSELRDYADTHPSFKEIADAISKAEGASDLDARMRKGADEFAAILKGAKP